MNTPSRQLPSVMTFGVSAISRDLQAADVGALDVTLADVEHQRHPTEVVGGAVVEREVARAHQLARTGLDVAALQVPGHRRTPLFEMLILLAQHCKKPQFR